MAGRPFRAGGIAEPATPPTRFRSVAIAPALESVGVLALLVVVRTFLNWSLGVERDGRWPRQRDPACGERRPPAVKSR